MKDEVLTPIELLERVKQLKPGERLMYYSGYLAANRTSMKKKMQQAALFLQDSDVAFLTSKRLGEFEYEYYITRGLKVETIPYLIDYGIKKIEQKV